MAVIVGWLVRHTLNVKPWIAQRPIGNARGDGAFFLPPVKVGLGAFLAVATSLFALSISAYYMRMMAADWVSLADPGVLWLNTALLILGSIFFQLAQTAAQRGRIGGVRAGLLAGGAFTFAFLVGQFWAWQQLNASSFFVATNPATDFFYMLTALHGLHLLGGLWVWGTTVAKLWRGVAVGKLRLSVELCTVYWHFLLVVWLILFGLLLST